MQESKNTPSPPPIFKDGKWGGKRVSLIYKIRNWAMKNGGILYQRIKLGKDIATSMVSMYIR
jgi:hypothetical protein